MYKQSKETSCSDYTTVEGTFDSSVTPEMEGTTRLTPLQEDCKAVGETVFNFTGAALKTEIWLN